MTALDPKEVAKHARRRALVAAEHVRYMRVLLGQAMAEEEAALRIAREAERAAA